MRTRLVFLISVLAVVFSSIGNAQCKDSVVGTWKLVSVTAKTDKESGARPFLVRILQGFSPIRRMAG